MFSNTTMQEIQAYFQGQISCDIYNLIIVQKVSTC